MRLVIAIALGGAIGAVSRHYVAGFVTRFVGIGFPYGTLTVNILGSFLMGILVALFAFKLNLHQDIRAFLTVGLLGGFTTFSAFSLESVLLMERGAWSLAGFYVLGSVVASIAALMLGLWSGKVFV